MSEKIKKITPEWQTEQKPSVDSAVARVKGKHHDGDVLSWMACYAVKSGGTASSLVLLDVEGFFYTQKTRAEKPHHHNYKSNKSTKENKTKNLISFLRRISNVQQSP